MKSDPSSLYVVPSVPEYGAKAPAELELLPKHTANNLETPPSRFYKLNLEG